MPSPRVVTIDAAEATGAIDADVARNVQSLSKRIDQMLQRLAR